MAAPALVLLGALFSGALSYISQEEQNQALKDAQDEDRKLEEDRIRREEEWKDYMKLLDEKKMATAEKMFRFEKSEARKTRAERQQDKAYAKRQNSIQQTLGLLNTSDVMRSNFLNVFRRAA